MRRILAVLLVGTCVVVLAAPAAHAGGHGVARVVIGLATFAIFAPFIVVGEVIAHAVPPYRAPAVVVAPPPLAYAPAPTYYAAPPAYGAPSAYTAAPAYANQTSMTSVPVQPRVVQYPHGRYVLQGDGITTAYQWVWIPNPPSAPPAPLPSAPSQ
jgi:hypothetical protein